MTAGRLCKSRDLKRHRGKRGDPYHLTAQIEGLTGGVPYDPHRNAHGHELPRFRSAVVQHAQARALHDHDRMLDAVLIGIAELPFDQTVVLRPAVCRHRDVVRGAILLVRVEPAEQIVERAVLKHEGEQ